jgi:peptidoglycan hydrolase-like protein with peptidoglycan-binding domain
MNVAFRPCFSKAFLVLALLLAVDAPMCVQPARAQSSAEVGLGSSDSIEGSLNIWERRLTQQGLILLGYYNGFADGSFGPSGRNAISSYQRDHNRPATGELSAQDALELGGAALDLHKQLQWRSLDNSLAGVTISYPATLLTQRKENTLGGENLQTEDGAISLKTARFANSGSRQLDTLYQNLLAEQGSTITYKLKRSNWFIVSGNAGDRKFYSRFEQRGNDIRGYDLSWNADKNSKLVENISVLISNDFYPFGENPSDGDPSYPTLVKLADMASANSRGSSSNAGDSNDGGTQSQQSNGSANTQTAQSDDKGDGLTEQKDGALPPPTDGSLVTSDGKGLRFVYHYFPPQDPKLNYAYQWASDTHLFLNIPEIDGLDGLFVTPRQLHYVTRQCNTVNAFYDKENGAVFLCYEMIDSLLQMGEALSKGASDPKALTIEFVRDNLRFILLHESGHALIDLLDLPAVGREEDSVDQLAAVLLLSHADDSETKNDIARVLQLASVWFKVNSQSSSAPDVASFADEHSLDAQRYFNLLCMVYGLDPENNGSIVENGMLPKERAARCPDEASKINRSWARLILPHFSPRFQPKSDEDNASQQTTAPQQPAAGGNPLEWDKKSNPFAR